MLEQLRGFDTAHGFTSAIRRNRYLTYLLPIGAVGKT
jgi:hypothetical protein